MRGQIPPCEFTGNRCVKETCVGCSMFEIFCNNIAEPKRKGVKNMSFCDTCGHQFSDVCGNCEGLDGVPVGYSPKPENVRPITEEVRLVHGVVDMATGTLVYKTARTNADRIRNKADEELADWISDQGVDCAYCRIESLCYEECKCGDCKKAWLKWLKQEVSDDS